jgi:hypothetical protein
VQASQSIKGDEAERGWRKKTRKSLKHENVINIIESSPSMSTFDVFSRGNGSSGSAGFGQIKLFALLESFHFLKLISHSPAWQALAELE